MNEEVETYKKAYVAWGKAVESGDKTEVEALGKALDVAQQELERAIKRAEEEGE